MNKQHLKGIVKKVIRLLGLFFVCFILIFINEITYGFGQFFGQRNIVNKAKPLEFFLSNPEYPDSLKNKIKLVQEIRRYAIDSLGLNDTKSYYKVYDQKGQEILWNVSACPPFELKPYEWVIPFAGKFPYHGHFNYENAISDYNYMKNKGYDVGFRSVSAWSTLGWMEDPILSNLLYRNEGKLAEIIIHEMTHGTIFVYSDGEFNENLATFVGELGAVKFLKNKYGINALQLLEYQNSKNDSKKYIQHYMAGAMKIDSLYKSFGKDILEKEKVRLKKELITEIAQSLDSINFLNKGYQSLAKVEELPNNTDFASILRYHGRQDDFKSVYTDKFKSNFYAYLEYLKKEYPL